MLNEIYKTFCNSTGVSIDTRNIGGGELFFCLKGENFNGNSFALKALEMGASHVIVDDADFYLSHKNMTLVDDSLKTLQQLAVLHRNQFRIPIIGITGTNGKTTTKELVSTVLGSELKVLFTLGNLNNHIGVPLTLLRLKPEHQIAVIEMGANHVGEIAELCALSQPDFGIITNIGKAHLEGFGSYENIIKTKLALYESVSVKHGTVFVNADDSLLMEKSSSISRITYGSNSQSQFSVQLKPSDHQLIFDWIGNTIATHLFGEYNLTNAASAIAVGTYFKISPENIVASLTNYKPTNNRSQVEKGSSNTLILDAYNANPSSMKQAVLSFRKHPGDDKMTILGDMLELGAYEKQEHKNILDELKIAEFGQIILVGKAFFHWKAEYPEFHFFENNVAALDYLKSVKPRGKVILLKGSRGIKLELLKETLL